MFKKRHRWLPWIAFLITAFIQTIAPSFGSKTFQETDPTKTDLIATLKATIPLLESKDYSGAAKYFLMPPNMKPDALRGILKSNELSKAGIQCLAEDAKFGKALELFGADRATRFADRFGADVSKCYGFNHEANQETAEVIALWDGTHFKLIRVDDVGKIASGMPDTNEGADEKKPMSSKTDQKELIQKELIQKAVLEIQRLHAVVNRNPNDISARANLAGAYYKIGNFPQAWVQLMDAYREKPDHAGISKGIDALFNKFSEQGIFSVGVPKETIQSLLGEPTEKLDLAARLRWRYAHWGVDFTDGRVGEIIDLRKATQALFEPTEKITTDFGGETWLIGFRRKQNGKSVAYYFVPGETMAKHTTMISVERLLDVPGTIEDIGKKLIEQEQVRFPGSHHKILTTTKNSMILATETTVTTNAMTRHRLVRLWKGPKDLHRLTYAVFSDDPPSADTQEKWYEIFQKAKLKTIE